jgi:predicted nucleic acid-binding protein
VIVVDTGPLVAAVDTDDAHHAACADLMRTRYRDLVVPDTYADLRLGMVDASIVAVAERLGITSVFTINRRDFTVVRPRHIAAFELLP